MNGQISFESRKNRGTTFKVNILFKKLKRIESDKKVLNKKNKVRKNPITHNLKIPLVEDNVTNQKRAKLML